MTPAAAPTALAPTAPGRARPLRTPRGRGRLLSAPPSAKPRFFYCTLARRLTCGDIHHEGTASLPPVKAERRTGVASFGTRLSLPLAVFPEAPSASPWACGGGRRGAGRWRSRRTASGSPPAAATGRCGSGRGPAPAVPGRSPEARERTRRLVVAR